MSHQNITLALPKDIFLKLEAIAARRQVSVSSLLVEEIEKLVQQEVEYGRARTRHLDLLEQGFDLGTDGRMASTRDELHERH